MMTDTNLHVFNNLSHDITFQYQYDECYHCLFNNVSVGVSNESRVSLMNYLPLTLQVSINSNNTDRVACVKRLTTVANEVYNLTVINYAVRRDRTVYSDINCLMDVPKNNYDYLLPLYVMLVLLCLSAALYYALLMMYRHRLLQRLGSRLFMYEIDSFEDLGDPRRAAATVTDDDDDGDNRNLLWTGSSTARKRIRTVDTMRGVAVVLMVFVNYGGGNYRFMAPSAWNGLTVADLIAPWFTFVMGVTMALSVFRFQLKRKQRFHWSKFFLRALKRAVILFVIGVGVENRDSVLTQLRIMGPLQRLAIAYLCLAGAVCVVSVAAALCRCQLGGSDSADGDPLLASSEINIVDEQRPLWCTWLAAVPDIVRCWPYIGLAIGLLVSHACVSLLLAVPNCPRGYMGPGGIDAYGCCGNCTGGVAGFIDRLVLSADHMDSGSGHWGPLFHATQRFDGEGILGCLSVTALCLLGFWAGNVMLLHRDWGAIIKRLTIYAVICAAIGTGLCQASINGALIPINMHLWSASYVLIASGTSFLLLAVLFGLIDVFKIWSGGPFRYPGMNPIVIYVGHWLLRTTFPVQWSLHIKFDHTYHLMINVWGALFWTAAAYIMFVKKLIIAV